MYLLRKQARHCYLVIFLSFLVLLFIPSLLWGNPPPKPINWQVNVNLQNPTSWVFHKDMETVDQAIYAMVAYNEAYDNDNETDCIKVEGTWRVTLAEDGSGYLLKSFLHKSPYHYYEESQYSRDMLGDIKGSVIVQFKIKMAPEGDHTRVFFEQDYYTLFTDISSRWLAPFLSHGRYVLETEEVLSSTFFEYSFLLALGKNLKEPGMPDIVANPARIRTLFHEERNRQYEAEIYMFGCVANSITMKCRKDFKLAEACITDILSGVRQSRHGDITNTDPFYAYCNRGLVRMCMKKYTEAETDFTSAIELGGIRPLDDEYYNRGVARFFQGKYQAALVDFKMRDKIVSGSEYSFYSTALQKAVVDGYLTISELLIKQGWDTSVMEDEFNTSLLGEAILHQNPEMVRLLLKYGANPYEVAFVKDSGITLAHDSGFVPVIRIIDDWVKTHPKPDAALSSDEESKEK